MKTTTFKKFIIPGGSILICLIAFGGISTEFKEAFLSELSNFDVHGLYAVLAMAAICVGIYALVNKLKGTEETISNQSVNYSFQRPLHHRAVIKKTA